MASYHIAALERLVEQFERLPGIGHKTAQRLAYYVLQMPKDQAEIFSTSILEARDKIQYCSICRKTFRIVKFVQFVLISPETIRLFALWKYPTGLFLLWNVRMSLTQSIMFCMEQYRQFTI